MNRMIAPSSIGAAVLALALAALAACGGGGDDDDDQPPGPPDPVGHWGPPESIVGFRGADVALSDGGDVFLLADSSVRRRVAGTGRWNGLYELPGVSRVAADPDGDALVAGEVLGKGAILGASFTTGDGWVSGWSPLAPLTPRVAALPTVTDLAMPGAGTAVLAWVQAPPTGSERTVLVAVFEPGVGWTAPLVIAGPVRTPTPAMATVDLGGELRTVIAWLDSTAGDVTVRADVLHYSRSTHALTREGPTVITRAVFGLLPRLEVGVDRGGRSTVLLASPDRLVLSRHFTDWQAPITIAPDDGQRWLQDEVHLAVDGGDALVLSTQCAATCVVRVQHALADGLGAPVELARGPARDLPGPSCLAAAGGRALAVWRDGAEAWTLRARERTTAWAAPQVIEQEIVASDLSRCELALTPGGTGVVGWARWPRGPEPAPRVTTAIYTLD